MQTKHLIRILVLGLRALMSLLVPTCLSTPTAQTVLPVTNPMQTVPGGPIAPAVASEAQTSKKTMPEGLMSAFLAASSQPFEAGANGYRYIEQEIVAPDGVAGNWFGFSVALNGDTALVGALGAVYVFTRSGTTWSLQQKLTVSDGAEFGASVALSGATALVGATGGPGSAYIFTRIGTTWGQRDKLTATDGADMDYFGYSVALDGATVLVGAPLDDVGMDEDQGSAYVFTPSGLWDWEQQAKLTAADGAAEDRFGWSVALSGDTALVGAYQDDVGANANQGTATVFTRSGTTWSQQAQLTASGGAGLEAFGYSVALAGDTALIGAPVGDGANAAQGAAYVFTRNGTTWGQRDKLTAADGETFDGFGCSVALSGGMALVGARYDDVGVNEDQGSAYVFTPGGLFDWEQQAKLTAADGAEYDYFGCSVALAGDTALVGAFNHDVGANTGQGAAYFYELLSHAIYLPLVVR